jgi:hypothetical protein
MASAAMAVASAYAAVIIALAAEHFAAGRIEMQLHACAGTVNTLDFDPIRIALYFIHTKPVRSEALLDLGIGCHGRGATVFRYWGGDCVWRRRKAETSYGEQATNEHGGSPS